MVRAFRSERGSAVAVFLNHAAMSALATKVRVALFVQLGWYRGIRFRPYLFEGCFYILVRRKAYEVYGIK